MISTGQMKLAQYTRASADNLIHSILSKIELIIPHNDGRLEVLRKQILTDINNFTRDLDKELKEKYEIVFSRTISYNVSDPREV